MSKEVVDPDERDDDNESSQEKAAAENKEPAIEDSSNISSDEQEDNFSKLKKDIDAAMIENDQEIRRPSATEHEIVAVPVREPSVELTADFPLAQCDRKVIRCVDEIFGPVLLPMYLVRFKTADKMPMKAAVNAAVYNATDHTVYIILDKIKGKGSDASNLFDEEEDEPEFLMTKQKLLLGEANADVFSGMRRVLETETWQLFHPLTDVDVTVNKRVEVEEDYMAIGIMLPFATPYKSVCLTEIVFTMINSHWRL
ncbi:hypothetical protein PsorP6_004506 [Peronosclerospora sorghi]|uniref:Uncharacterized protein n=1 Tax=Peronosclerospora sorghi TaxID=230839 RepID=A0ACC0VP24_9STRA|nr:hypothetical protein PsorP6_004506 [Peronosclerospora sorghi]